MAKSENMKSNSSKLPQKVHPSNDPSEFNPLSYSLEKFRLYETRARFYLIGSDRNKQFFRVLKIDRMEPSDLNISEDPVVYPPQEVKSLLQRIAEGNRATGGLNFVAKVYGIAGCIKFLESYYLVLVTKRRQIGSICGHAIYSIDESQIITIPHVSVQTDVAHSKTELRYKKLLSSVDLTKDFFYSYTYPIMRSLQNNVLSMGEDGMPYDNIFVWNSYLTHTIRSRCKNTMWTIALVHGHFKQTRLSIFGKDFSVSLISRRSRHFAGTRYLKRGVNDHGRVANDVETEQIVLDEEAGSCKGKMSSVVQMRGSIPLFWSQEASRFSPKPDIILQRYDPTYEATRLHFEDLARRYGNPIIILNLIKTVEKRPREMMLRREFANAVGYLNQILSEENHLKFIHWDFHKFAKSKSANVLAVLGGVASEALDLTGFYYSGKPVVVKRRTTQLSRTSTTRDSSLRDLRANSGELSRIGSNNEILNSLIKQEREADNSQQIGKDNDENAAPKFQSGVLRTNCIDCLDRTNVAQYAYGLEALGRQLHAMGLTDRPKVDADSSIAAALMDMYQGMGDALAQQYGGSAAHNTVFPERQGKWKATTQSREFLKSIKRYYSNAYTDGEKQDAINLFLGYFQPQEGKPALWELDSDYYLHVSGIGDDLIPDYGLSFDATAVGQRTTLAPVPACREDFLRMKLTSFDKLLEKTCCHIKNVRLCSETDLLLAAKDQMTFKQASDIFIIKTLIAYQSISDPTVYRRDHARLIQICATPYREASKCEESSCLRMLLDKRDAWLGPWNPGRDLFEDELRSFQGGKDGLVPCVWANELPSFPKPETISKMLVNQKLLCVGNIFASEDVGGMLSLLEMVEQCLRAGKKQAWHATSVTNICVGLLSGLKALLALRPEPLPLEVLGLAQSIFQSILAEGDICASQCRASSEGLGLLARLGNDVFTARLTRVLLGDINSAVDSNYAGSVALSLGCIHRSAGGIALSSLVPATVNSFSSLAKSSNTGLQIWSLHGLLLTVEAAGLSYVSHVQATLSLAMDILLSNEIGSTNLQQAVGRLINAIVAVLGPELSPGSIFFSRCKSVIAEVSSRQETATLFENVRFTQQLVLFAPQAVTVHHNVQTLLPTLSSRQPTLRRLALSTLRHLIEKDPGSIMNEHIEDTLFHMLDEETDAEIGSLARTTVMRLLYASCPSRPSQWLSICRNMILSSSSRVISTSDSSLNDSSSGLDGNTRLNTGDDDENMVSSSQNRNFQGYGNNHSIVYPPRDKHLRYRTRVFAAECLSHLPAAVGKNPVHFDIALARQMPASGSTSGDWLVLQLQELVSLAYQISTIQFENMRPVGVTLLSTIIDKFGTLDPELPGHLLLEQYQAQLVSAVRTALDSSSGPVLLEAGLQLATKILTCKIVSRDQLAVKRIFSLISRPLNEFNDLYYPSFAEWVSCKIKVRLLTAHASLKCYTFAFLKSQQKEITDEYLALLPLFSESSKILGIYWLCLLKDYSYIRTQSFPKENWKPFLDGIQSTLVSTMLLACLEEAWPLIVQAVALDAVPLNTYIKGSSETEEQSITDLISGYNMVELGSEEFQFLWGFALLLLFQGQDSVLGESRLLIGSVNTILLSGGCVSDEVKSIALELCEVALPVFQVLLAERFFSVGFLTMDSCQELLQVCFFSIFVEDTWDNFAISILSQIVQNCPLDFLKTESFVYLVSELYLALLFKSFTSATSQYHLSWDDIVSVLLTTAPTLLKQYEPKMGLKSILAFLLVGYKCIERASTEISLSRVHDFVQCLTSVMKSYVTDISELGNDSIGYLMTITRTCLTASVILAENCTKGIHQLENKRSNLHKLLLLKLALSLEQTTSFAKLAFEIQLLEENQGCKPVFYAMICNATRCFRSALTDADIQVQAIGLQILKGVLTRKINSEYSFFVFFVGELVEDLGSVIQKLFKTPMNREVVAIAGECLKVLMLLQTLSRTNECQKCLMNLFLEAVLLFTTSENSSQEARDLKITTIKLVTQLAQLPDSSACIKEVLLTMPMMRRQQLQDIIRASVMQDQNQKQVNSTGPSFIIKLPAKIEESRKEEIIVSAPCSEEVEDNSEEEEEDDWDTFQSFPSTNEVDPTKTAFQDSRSIENTISDDGFKGESISVPQDEAEETTATISDGGLKGETISIPEDEVGEITAENQMASDDETLSGNADSSNQTQDLNGSQDGFHDDKLSDAHHMEKDRAVLRHGDVILPDSQSEVGKGPETCENLEVQKRTGGNLSSEVGEHAEDVKAHGSSYEDHQRSREESSETNEGALPNIQPAEIQSMPLDDRNEDMKEQITLDDHHEDEEMRDITSIKDHQEGKDLKDTTSLEDHHEEKDLKDITSLKNHREKRKTDNEDQRSDIDLSEQSPKKLEQTTLDDHHEEKDMRDITTVKDHHEEKDMKDMTSLEDYHEERKTENEDLCSAIDLSERSPKNLEQTTLDHHEERNAENKDQHSNIELAEQSPKNLEGDELVSLDKK